MHDTHYRSQVIEGNMEEIAGLFLDGGGGGRRCRSRRHRRLSRRHRRRRRVTMKENTEILPLSFLCLYVRVFFLSNHCSFIYLFSLSSSFHSFYIVL